MSGAINKAMIFELAQADRLDELEQQGPGVFFGAEYLFQPFAMVGFDRGILEHWNKIRVDDLGMSMNNYQTKYRLWSVMLRSMSFHRDPQRVVLLPFKIERFVSFSKEEVQKCGILKKLETAKNEMDSNIRLYNLFLKTQLKKRGLPLLDSKKIAKGNHGIVRTGIEYIF